MKISSGEFNLSLVDDDDAKDLLSRMICVKPEYRITADEVDSWYNLVDLTSSILEQKNIWHGCPSYKGKEAYR